MGALSAFLASPLARVVVLAIVAVIVAVTVPAVAIWVHLRFFDRWSLEEPAKRQVRTGTRRRP